MAPGMACGYLRGMTKRVVGTLAAIAIGAGWVWFGYHVSSRLSDTGIAIWSGFAGGVGLASVLSVVWRPKRAQGS
jgi:hypothetical protein